MIKAVSDKIIVQMMKAEKTAGGLILPEGASEPQAYGKVLSVGEEVENITEGDFLVFFPRAGMDCLIDKDLLKVLKYEEVYGILQDETIKKSLVEITIGRKEESRIVTV